MVLHVHGHDAVADALPRLPRTGADDLAGVKRAEVQKGVAYVARHQEESKRAGAPSDRVELEAWTSYGRVLMMANEFLFVD